MYKSLLAGALALSGAVLVAAQREEPCLTVAREQAEYFENFPNDPIAHVSAASAIACLASVPLQTRENLALIREIKLYLTWQSSISYLKNPPEGYTGDTVDILEALDNVTDRLNGGEYASEYEFQLDLYMAIRGGYDFHLVWMPDILSVFLFQKGNVFGDELFGLVSMSEDGQEIPKLYNYFDVMGNGRNLSPVSEINGEPAEDYVKRWAATSPYHDKDARYNRQFINQAGLAWGDEVNEFVLNVIPDGATTSVTHENGTSFEYPNYAKVLQDFSTIDSGETFFRTFCNQGPPPAPPGSEGLRKRQMSAPIDRRALASTIKRQNQQTAPPGFPEPVLLHSENVVGGYYLSGNGYDSVAVLSIPSFGPNQVEAATEFQDVVQKFLAEANASGKTRLIIDTRSNGGGRVFLGYDLFKQLFPNVDPWGATRFRANDAFNVAGQAMTEKLSGISYDDAISDFRENSYNGLVAMAWASIFNYKLPRNSRGEPFNSWEDLFGPFTYNGDKFTSLERYDFENFFSDDLDMDVSGFRSRSDELLPSPPFDPENIVILQDGTCGSTCAIFAELMKAQTKVQQVVIGGEPATGPMQSVSGSKGAQVWSYDLVFREAANAFEFLEDFRDQLNGTDVGNIVQAERPLMRSAYDVLGRARSSINLRDNIRAKDSTNTPLEFVYEAADCRLFYTRNMLRDVESVWRAAADARWADNKGCIADSVGHPSSVQGGADLPGTDLEAAAGALSPRSSALTLAAVLVVSLLTVGF